MRKYLTVICLAGALTGCNAVWDGDVEGFIQSELDLNEMLDSAVREMNITRAPYRLAYARGQRWEPGSVEEPDKSIEITLTRGSYGYSKALTYEDFSDGILVMRQANKGPLRFRLDNFNTDSLREDPSNPAKAVLRMLDKNGNPLIVPEVPSWPYQFPERGRPVEAEITYNVYAGLDGNINIKGYNTEQLTSQGYAYSNRPKANKNEVISGWVVCMPGYTLESLSYNGIYVNGGGGGGRHYFRRPV